MKYNKLSDIDIDTKQCIHWRNGSDGEHNPMAVRADMGIKSDCEQEHSPKVVRVTQVF